MSLDQRQQDQDDPFIWYQSKLRVMVQETRNGVLIKVLHENLQGIQQQIDEQANVIGLLGARMDRIENIFSNLQALVEDRLPPRQQAPLVQPEPQGGAQSGQGGGVPNVGEQPPILEPVEPILIGVEARNAMPMRFPTHEVQLNPNQPRFGMSYDDPFDPRLRRLNDNVTYTKI